MLETKNARCGTGGPTENSPCGHSCVARRFGRGGTWPRGALSNSLYDKFVCGTDRRPLNIFAECLKRRRPSRANVRCAGAVRIARAAARLREISCGAAQGRMAVTEEAVRAIRRDGSSSWKLRTMHRDGRPSQAIVGRCDVSNNFVMKPSTSK